MGSTLALSPHDFRILELTVRSEFFRARSMAAHFRAMADTRPSARVRRAEGSLY
jgi:hypothetical protein